MHVTAGLAEFAAGLSYNKLPPDVREQPRMFLLDTISVALGACDFFKKNGRPAGRVDMWLPKQCLGRAQS